MRKITSLIIQFNGPVQEFENQGKKHVEGDEGDHDRCESEDTEEDSNDDTVVIVETEDKHTCNAEGGADLDTIPEGVDVEGNSKVQDEKYSGKKDIKVIDKTERYWCYKILKNQRAIFKTL